MQFDSLPHLCYPVIQDPRTGYEVVQELYAELERRITLKNEDIEAFNRLPIIVVVFDEVVSLITEVGRSYFPKIISQLLRRGRHARIHMVLAAQDPLIRDMKCDIGNATARLAFTCAKPHYSVTILGESGAHKLTGEGEAYFRSPKHSGLMYIKGAYIADDEIAQVCDHVRSKYENMDWDDSRKFKVRYESSVQTMTDFEDVPATDSAAEPEDAEDKFFAEVIMLALGYKTISALHIKDAYKTGWPRGNALLDRLHEFGVVSAPHARQPRKVLASCIEDLSPELLGFLERYGYGDDQITEAFNSRK
jgi:S-DNA-T family DNA segregation ATPase FtsK/SpoIIIE